MRVLVERGDITKARVDAIVNAANPYLRGGGGVDGAIHRAAGPELLKACQELPVVGSEPGVPVRCPVGEARITSGFALTRYVVHAVGPVYPNYNHAAAVRLLASAYVMSLRLAEQHGCRSVALPAISCGLYRFPLEAAADTVNRVLTRVPWSLDEVRLVMFTEDTFEAFSVCGVVP